LRIVGTELFVGTRQIVRVFEAPPGPVVVRGEGIYASADADGDAVEVPVETLAEPGTAIPIEVTAGGVTEAGELVVAEPGWTVWMVSHFHYDPVWWTTQAAYTATWGAPGQTGNEFRADFQHTGFDLVKLHLETARREPEYKFVLAELDYLKPYWDAHPEDRAYLRRLLDEGRLELVGGTYNEPNTNLTAAETTIRNLVYGVGFQRDVLGGDPRTAWQLDAFGHDPQFPGLVADAGLDSSSWARGPFHQWGPMQTTYTPGERGWGDPSTMQFPAELDWLSPSGRGVLTHYMPAHYSSGWHIDSQPTLAAAEENVYRLFLLLKKVAATRNVLLPVGTDYSPPAKWVTAIHRDWNARYTWPRLICGLPKEFFGAVREELSRSNRRASPQTRDMNPIYTGKDVSFIDTKQAQRHAEALLVDAEAFATVAAITGGQQRLSFPHEEVDLAWRQLAFGAHHDGITGSESDQVYLDLLTGWREAHDLAGRVLDRSLAALCEALPTSTGDSRRIVVFNPTAWTRSDLVRARVEFPTLGTTGVAVGGVPVLIEHAERHPDGSLSTVDVVFRADDVPSVGYRAWPLTPGDASDGWQPVEDTTTIENDTYRLTVDPSRGGAVSSLVDLRTGREIVADGRVGNELLVYAEYPAHPQAGEGPWHLLPKGAPVTGSAAHPAGAVVVEHSPLGQRVTVTGSVGPAKYTQTLTLWSGIARVDAVSHVDEFTGEDQLIRLRWPAAIPGALPVSEVGNAVIGRGFGLIDVDSGPHPWTLDNPAYQWFALSSTARITAGGHPRAIGVAEVIGDGDLHELVTTLVRRGVTATCSTPDAPRYGRLAVDSNLPDVRIAVGGPSINSFTSRVLAAAGQPYADEAARQLSETGRLRLWVPADRPLTEAWVPDADLSDVRALPVLILGTAEDFDFTVDQPSELSASPDPDLEDYTVGLVNRGMPGFAVDSTGALHLSLLRSCTGWPSGIWIDPPRRCAPDGSNFQQQHWTHSFEYSLVAGDGDWRSAGLVAAGHEVNHPLHARVAPVGPVGAASYVTLEPEGELVLAALKPTGNPLAGGRRPASEIAQVTARVYEPYGRPVNGRLALPVPVTSTVQADLLEQPLHPASGFALEGAGIGQVLLGIEPVTAAPSVADDRLAYAKYWLHNTGPAPLGNMPVSVHFEQSHVDGSAPATLTVTVASSLVADTAGGELTIEVPDGWRASPSTVAYALEPGEHLSRSISVIPVGSPTAGVYWARARISPGVEDVVRLLVDVDAPETIEARLEPAVVRLRPGEAATLDLTVSTDAAGPISVQAHLISPWHTWPMLPEASRWIPVPTQKATRVELPVRIPADQRPGRWWALVRLGHGGQLHYTAPVSIEVGA